MKQFAFPRCHAGLSLIELMVAITLGLMITASLGYLMVGSRSTYRTQDASARVQDTGRFAMEFIGRNLLAAGRTDITPLFTDSRVGLPSNVVPITGTNGANTVNTGGTPATRDVDNLTVVYQLSTLNGKTIQDCNGADVGKTLNGGDIKKADGTIVGVYGSVRSAIRMDVANFELECLGNGSNNAQPFAEGVEDLQLVYGVDSNGDDAVDSWSTAVPGTVSQIVAVQVCIMVRSLGNGVVGAPQTLRDCSGTSFTPNDTRLRRTFTSVFTLRNRVNLLPQ